MLDEFDVVEEDGVGASGGSEVGDAVMESESDGPVAPKRLRCPGRIVEFSSAPTCAFICIRSARSVCPAIDDHWSRGFDAGSYITEFVHAIVGIPVYNWRCVRCDAEVADDITVDWQTKFKKN